jgi:hypothetical protein
MRSRRFSRPISMKMMKTNTRPAVATGLRSFPTYSPISSKVVAGLGYSRTAHGLSGDGGTRRGGETSGDLRGVGATLVPPGTTVDGHVVGAV